MGPLGAQSILPEPNLGGVYLDKWLIFWNNVAGDVGSVSTPVLNM